MNKGDQFGRDIQGFLDLLVHLIFYSLISNYLFVFLKFVAYIMSTSVCLGHVLQRKEEAVIRGQREEERTKKRMNAQKQNILPLCSKH